MTLIDARSGLDPAATFTRNKRRLFHPAVALAVAGITALTIDSETAPWELKLTVRLHISNRNAEFCTSTIRNVEHIFFYSLSVGYVVRTTSFVKITWPVISIMAAAIRVDFRTGQFRIKHSGKHPIKQEIVLFVFFHYDLFLYFCGLVALNVAQDLWGRTDLVLFSVVYGWESVWTTHCIGSLLSTRFVATYSRKITCEC